MPESMKKNKSRLAAILLAGCMAAAGAAHAQTMNLQKVMSQMDASSKKFQDVQADFSADLYTAVVQEHEIQKGTTAFRRAGSALEMVTHIQTDNGQAAERYVLYKGGQLTLYEPGLKQATVMSAGGNRGQWDSMLATGFGATSKDLNAAWTVTFQGMETVDGKQTAKLDLVPKDAGIRNNMSHLTIWMDLSRDISLKQVMYQPDGDSRTVTYSNIRYNPHLSSSLFTLHMAKGTQVIHK